MEEKYESFKQMPSDLDNFNVRTKDIAVYLTMRQYENWQTHTTHVSVNTLSKKMGLGKSTIRKCIKNLVNDGYLSMKKIPGSSNEYAFNKTEKFEGFSDKFINNPDLTPDQKGYLAIIQQYMNTSDGERGIITLRDMDIANLTHMSRQSIYNYNRELQDKGYLVIGNSNLPDNIENSGCKSKVKVYDPKAYGQAILFTLRDHENRITDVEDNMRILVAKVENLERQQQIKDQQIDNLRKENISGKKTIRNLTNALNLKLQRQGCRL